MMVQLRVSFYLTNNRPIWIDFRSFRIEGPFRHTYCTYVYDVYLIDNERNLIQTQTQIQNPSPGIRQTGTGEVVTVSVTVTAMNLLPVSILSLPLEDDNDSSTKPVNTVTCLHGFSRLKTTLTYARCLSKKRPSHPPVWGTSSLRRCIASSK